MKKLTAEQLIDKKYPDKTKPTGVSTQEMVELMEEYASQVRSEEREKQKTSLSQRAVILDALDSFLKFLLENGYCDTDVYCESPSAIDRYLKQQ